MAEDFTPRSIQFLQNQFKFPSSHVETMGLVVYKTEESDGDWHIILAPVGTDKSLSTLEDLRNSEVPFIVCEAIPEVPLANGIPIKHTIITVQGLYRWDYGHGWPEVHPLLSWELNG